VNEPFECPGPGLWPNPDNCQCFYNCANHVAFPDCCPDGDYFDSLKHICDWDYNVDCGDRPGPGSTRPTQGPSTSPGPKPTTTHQPTKPEPTTTHVVTKTTTQDKPETTTTRGPPGTTTTWDGNYPGFPKKVIGMYLPLADETEDGFHDDADWEPKLYSYQQNGANVLFFCFINPATMDVPKAFGKLAATKGTNVEGAVPADTRIIFAIGGYAYSIDPNPWEWLTSKDKAEAMAEKVARWRNDHHIDGIDLDIEEGAGSKKEAGPNLIHFIRKLRALVPDMLISQPTYGYPQIQAEIDVINASWNDGGSSNNLAHSIGLMVYEGTQALNYVKNFAAGSDQWEGFPIHVDVPKPSILLGCKGSSSGSTIMQLAEAAVQQDLLGVMVWSCSVVDGLVYGRGWDCSESEDSKSGYVAAMEYLKQHSE